MQAIIKQLKEFRFDHLGHGNFYAFSFLFGMLGAIVIFSIVHGMEKPSIKLGTVNVTGIVNQFLKQESEKNISSDDQKKEVKLYGEILDKELHKFSKEKGIVLVLSEAVIAGVPDYTSVIYRQMQN